VHRQRRHLHSQGGYASIGVGCTVEVWLNRAQRAAADVLAARAPREAHEARAVVMRRRRVRRGKGVAIELGVDRHGADLHKPRKQRSDGINPWGGSRANSKMDNCNLEPLMLYHSAKSMVEAEGCRSPCGPLVITCVFKLRRCAWLITCAKRQEQDAVD